MKKIFLVLLIIVPGLVTFSQSYDNPVYSIMYLSKCNIYDSIINLPQRTIRKDTIYGTVLYVDSSGVLSSSKGYTILIDNICDSCFVTEHVYIVSTVYLLDDTGYVTRSEKAFEINYNAWYEFIRKDDYQPFKSWNYFLKGL